MQNWKFVAWSTVIWATNHLGDSQLGDTPTGRHFSVNWATQRRLLRGQRLKCNILKVLNK